MVPFPKKPGAIGRNLTAANVLHFLNLVEDYLHLSGRDILFAWGPSSPSYAVIFSGHFEKISSFSIILGISGISMKGKVVIPF